MGADTPSRRIDAIEFVAIEAAAAESTGALAASMSRRVAVACVVRSEPAPAYPPRLEMRDQIDADRLLAHLEAEPPKEPLLRVGVTASDLGSALFSHMFGQARLGGWVALVSMLRLHPAFYGLAADPPLVIRRARLETLHEIGHLVGLRHCRDFGCLMHRAVSVEDIDVRGTDFCPSCLPAIPAGLLT